jgi:Tfp pilus assembly protein FimT
MVAMAVPMVKSVFQNYQLRSAVSYASGTIQSTRYQALQNGYPFQLVLTAAGSTMQIQNDKAIAGAWTNVGNAVPISGSGTPVTLGADTTMTFRPGGMVQSASADANGNTTITLTQAGRTATIVVSRYGNINVAYAP